LTNKDYQTLLKVYFKEMDSCKAKLNNLVKNCIDIYFNRNVAISDLLDDNSDFCKCFMSFYFS
jgi:hypothetical protein